MMYGKEDAMKKGYWVVAYRSISDESALKASGALALPAVGSFGGRFLTSSTSQVQAHGSRIAATDRGCSRLRVQRDYRIVGGV